MCSFRTGALIGFVRSKGCWEHVAMRRASIQSNSLAGIRTDSATNLRSPTDLDGYPDILLAGQLETAKKKHGHVR